MLLLLLLGEAGGADYTQNFLHCFDVNARHGRLDFIYSMRPGVKYVTSLEFLIVALSAAEIALPLMLFGWKV